MMTAHFQNYLKQLPCSLYRSVHRVHPDWYALGVLAVMCVGLAVYTIVGG